MKLLFEAGINQNLIRKKLHSILCFKCHSHNQEHVKVLARNCYLDLRRKWKSVNRTKSIFLKKYAACLEKHIIVYCTESKNSLGRPKSDFSQLTYSGKYKRTNKLRKSNPDELVFATELGLRVSGKPGAAKLLTNVVSSNESNIKKINEAFKSNHLISNKPARNQLSAAKALALVVDCRLSKRQYQNLRNNAKENDVELYPAYNLVREAKKMCYPLDIISTENSVVVKLQSLLDHTTSRLLSTLELENHFKTNQSLTLISKWGMDGSSGQKEYKQAFRGEFSDSNLLLSCLVPIQLYTENEKKEKIVVWNNPRPSSTFYCRPIKMQFLKETKEISKREYDALKAEIDQLIETQFVLNTNITLLTKHHLFFTMVDGKMINSITDTSSQKCYLCNATPAEMNDIDKLLDKPVHHNNLQFGITPLHAWIRTFECLLKVCYRLPLQKWQARGEDKIITKDQKMRVQAGFRSHLGIIVDQTKQGAGTSNDGNTARKFFQNFVVSAEITGLNQNIIYRFYIILQVIASGITIKINEFRAYCLETAKEFVFLYPWYKMPATMHKILLHGWEIVQYCPVPIGQFSEEAQEARNKEYRRYREHNSRKFNRIATNSDIFNNLLISSDPKISALRNKVTPKKNPLSPEALKLLQSLPANPRSSISDTESDTESD